METHCSKRTFGNSKVFTRDSIDIERAAERGHLEIVKYLYENQTEECSFLVIDSLSKHDHFDYVKSI
jgi:hypothetical protein